MIDTRQFLIQHGAPVLFGAVFVEQIGLPIPALPWMLAVGALAATGSFNAPEGVCAAVLACVIADFIWFYMGRLRGVQVLNFLCRISLEPDSCVRRTQNAFSRWGLKGIIVAKFIPGLNTMAPPIAGMSKISAGQFALVDTLGSVLYGGCCIYLGYLFSSQIQQIESALASIGGSALCLVIGVIVAYVAYKYWQRKQLLDELRMTRVTADEVHQMQSEGKSLAIIDMRSAAELERDPVLIAGAVHLSLDDIEQRRYKIPADQEVIVYCSCPNEVTAARVALLLRRQGFSSVRPMLGGLDAWRDLNYPLDNKSPAESSGKTDEERSRN
ncbi:MAG TPA: DedA family protein/thiosulfate sulfurtransferase GlpE [Verrucomicrobiae bacterium]|jgi:membrane protein DedA with SNARE-associated domain/rhodanese-related sulfurtransferase